MCGRNSSWLGASFKAGPKAQHMLITYKGRCAAETLTPPSHTLGRLVQGLQRRQLLRAWATGDSLHRRTDRERSMRGADLSCCAAAQVLLLVCGQSRVFTDNEARFPKSAVRAGTYRIFCTSIECRVPSNRVRSVNRRFDVSPFRCTTSTPLRTAKNAHKSNALSPST